MTKYLSPRTDISFKRLFANEHNTSLTIDFLNSILNLSGPQAIDKIILRQTVNLPDRAQGKEIIFDVYCTDAKNNHFIIEMQAVNEYNFHERSQYYAARVLGTQLKSNETYLDLVPVIFVGVVNYSLEAIKKYKRDVVFRNDAIITLEKSITESEDVITKYSFINHKTQQIIPVPLIELNFVELPKFKKAIQDCITPVDKWLYLMTQVDSCDHIPEGMKTTPALVQAFDSLEEKQWNQQDLEQYIKEQEAIGKEDRISQGSFEHGKDEGISIGIAHGIKQGMQQGIEQGALKKAIETAHKLLQRQVPIEDIADFTGLSIEQVKELTK